MRNGLSLLALLCLLVAFFPAATEAARITTRDGNVVEGELQSLADGVYVVRTARGPVRIPAASVVGIDNSAANPGPAQPSTGVLRFAGSTTIGDELMPALIEHYAASIGDTHGHWTSEGDATEQAYEADGAGPDPLKAHLSRHGSATAFTALVDGKADVGMASRPVNKDEIAKLAAIGFGAADAPGQEHVLALDGLVVLVNRANPLDRLSMAELAAIFSGQTTDWSQVGGPPGPIHVIARDAKSGTADTFKGLVLKDKKIVPSAELMDTSDGLSDKVAADHAAIGFAGFAYTRRAKALAIQTDCGLEVAPAEFFVRTEEYPLSRRLFLYAKAGDAGDETHRFIRYALGPEGQDEAARKGFVDLAPRLSPSDYSANRIATALSQVAQLPGDTSMDLRALQVFNKLAAGARRMSVTFRFRTASFDLDSRAVSDIDRLAAALSSPEMAGRAVAIVGFSDSQGSAARNVRLAQARAARIAVLLRNKGITAKAVLGLGRSAPVACNTSPEGMEKNRRVEVWLSNQKS